MLQLKMMISEFLSGDLLFNHDIITTYFNIFGSCRFIHSLNKDNGLP